MDLAWLRLRKIVRGLQSPAGRTALRRGVGASVEHASLLPRSMGLDLIVDVGANRGQFALFCQDQFPGARLVCFEPNPIAADVFDDLLGHRDGVALHRLALGDEPGEVELLVTQDDDSSSLLAPTEIQHAVAPRTVVASTATVEVARLDAVLDGAELRDARRSLLKVDVQGYEVPVLTGCGDLLAEFSHVLVELSLVELYRGQALFDEALGVLSQHGFHLIDLAPGLRHEGRPVQFDCLLANGRATSD